MHGAHINCGSARERERTDARSVCRRADMTFRTKPTSPTPTRGANDAEVGEVGEVGQIRNFPWGEGAPRKSRGRRGRGREREAHSHRERTS